MKRKGQVCVLFEQVPEGTHYREGAYSWVDEGEARQYIDKGYGKEYDPKENEPQELEPAEPKDNLGDLPGASSFKQVGITKMEEVEALLEDDDLQSVEGIGESTEQKIKDYIGE